ncbi:N-acetylmuramic acid 6-phosphate etherase [Symbiobacterium terraclitae]|uniref:N-acetylmuramic acid 6-phosphate etherase n=1 Tax=Symbiobacterium terraclitae TaxID=557451 RepID=A0ABS4JRG4_9FIRM|nr:N-acetylmuramic acid 6-phosphate etherase [Symbiobacterium terraclitae]MBP2017550.1 N-acetylmuramic acid 6-phosphate etherase [Symbiobacterium terraclitae]
MDTDHLVTESRLEASRNIDQVSTEEMVRIINEQDKLVALAVEQELPRIARAIDLIAARLREGGRLFYVGAGTSGRLGVLDASEIPPTYGTPHDLVQGVIAGGPEAVFVTREGAEDSREQGVADIAARVKAGDVVVGIAASGRTPYTVAAVEEARRRGCATVAVTNNPGSALAAAADVAIAPVVGPEVVMGSTRMKAGTAQKMVLNMLSTGAMIRLGKVYTNLMVDMQASNEKLRQRAVRMVALAAETDEETAGRALSAAGGSVKQAIVALVAGVDPAAAREALERAGGLVRKAIALAQER